MECPECRKIVPDDTPFCAYCGAIVKNKVLTAPRLQKHSWLLALAVLCFGLGLGLQAGSYYSLQIDPVEWENAGPQDLRVDFASYYWELVAESWSEHGDIALAEKQLDIWSNEKGKEALERARIESSPELQMNINLLEKELVDRGSVLYTPDLPRSSPWLPGILGSSLLLASLLIVSWMIIKSIRTK